MPLTTMPLLALLGVGSLGLLAVRTIWSTSNDRELLHYAFVPPLLMVVMGYASSALLEITDRLIPQHLITCSTNSTEALVCNRALRLAN